jgi:hypothetical protein
MQHCDVVYIGVCIYLDTNLLFLCNIVMLYILVYVYIDMCGFVDFENLVCVP